MLHTLVSGDYPRSRVVAALVVAIVVVLAILPLVGPGAKALNVGAKVLVFVLLVASFDLLLGYTGIVSFAHTMFFGIGAYGIAIASTRMGAGWDALALGLLTAVACSGLLAFVVGLFSLRVKAIFYAMITLAVAAAFQTFASQLPEFTGGEDGLTFKVPAMLQPAYSLVRIDAIGAEIGGRAISYYLLFAVVAVCFVVLLSIVNSPFGRVLQAIRENDFRAEAIGYRTVVFRTLSNVLAALFATVAGALFAIWLRYNGPDTTLSFEIMLDILLIVVIGGMGTMYGAIVGAALFLVAQSYLQDLLGLIGGLLGAVPYAPQLFSADRWLLWLGVLFVLSVYYFPTGIVGRLRAAALARATRPDASPPG